MPVSVEKKCLLCGALRPPMTGESQWRSALVGSTWFHACPDHFPPDGASAKEYEDAYVAFLQAAVEAWDGKGPLR